MIASLPRSVWLRTATAAYVVAFLVFLFLPLAIVAVFAFNDAPYPARRGAASRSTGSRAMRPRAGSGSFMMRHCLAASGRASSSHAG